MEKNKETRTFLGKPSKYQKSEILNKNKKNGGKILTPDMHYPCPPCHMHFCCKTDELPCQNKFGLLVFLAIKASRETNVLK